MRNLIGNAKRLLAGLLAVIMVVTALPANVFATELNRGDDVSVNSALSDVSGEDIVESDDFSDGDTVGEVIDNDGSEK